MAGKGEENYGRETAFSPDVLAFKVLWSYVVSPFRAYVQLKLVELHWLVNFPLW